MLNKLPIDMIIIDFDGTLVNSIPPAIDAIQEMLVQLKYPIKSKQEIAGFVGFGERPLVEGSIGSTDRIKVQAAQDKYYEIYGQKLKTIPLYPHIDEFLMFIKNKVNIVFSNKRDEFIRIILEQHRVDSIFNEIIGGDTAKSLKPDPSQVLELLAKYKIDNNRAMFVGDMDIDVMTGKNSNVHTCAVAYGFDPLEKLQASQPEFLVNDILELKELIV